MDEIKKITNKYMFYNESPYFETVSLRSTNRLTENQLYYYLHAEIDVGECIEDEWMIANALFKISHNHPDFIVWLFQMFSLLMDRSS